jgi:sporulation protein YlmC with PRC-barrel domain
MGEGLAEAAWRPDGAESKSKSFEATTVRRVLSHRTVMPPMVCSPHRTLVESTENSRLVEPIAPARDESVRNHAPRREKSATDASSGPSWRERCALKRRITMKKSNKSRIIAALGAITCLAPVFIHAQTPGVPPSQPGGWRGTQTMRVADSSNLPGENVNDLIGKKITGNGQQDLGTIKDFFLDARSGRIAFVVAAGANANDPMRLLSPQAFQSSSPGSEINAQLDPAAFQAAPTITQQEFDSGNPPANLANTMYNGRGGQLVRASKLTTRQVSSSGQEVGTIDEVGINLQAGTASLLFRTNPNFAGAESRFELPLNRLEYAQGGQLTTRLTRADFAQVPGSNLTAGNTQPSAPGTWATGRDSTPPTEASNNAAAAIRSAIAADPNLVREDITVHAAGQRVMLRGRASSEAAKAQIETLARTHAGGVAVDNNVRVGN